MSGFKLKYWQRRQLRHQLDETADARTYRRTLAVLELDRGRPAAEIADMLGVARQSVYNWAADFVREPDPAVLRDVDRCGRPPFLAEQAEGLLPLLMGRSPQDLGYPHTNWTVPVLQEELTKGLGMRPSDETVRRGLRRLGYVWKRPRYVLEPDPQREKKTADSPADPWLAPSERRPGRGRDRPEALPAAARRLVVARRVGRGPPQRLERQAGHLRSDGTEDGHAAVLAASQGLQRRLPGAPRRDPSTVPWSACRAAPRRGVVPYGEGFAASGRGHDVVVAAGPRAGIEPDGHAVGPGQGRGGRKQAVRDDRRTSRSIPQFPHRDVGLRGIAYVRRPLR
jgi:transposase